MDEQIQKIIKEYEDYAEEKGFRLNPDKRMVENVIKAMLKREETFGKRYCPCRRMTEDEEKNKEIICPCKFHLEEIEKNGQCHCFLFFK